MRKGIKFGFGVALAAVAGFAMCPTAQAGELSGDYITTTSPAVALVMPFDVTENHASFELVSRIGGSDATSDPVATHWSFWSESCAHLADVFICLTPRDTVVVDPSALQGQIQSGQKNTPTGPLINLSGEKGFITVTAFEASSDSETCKPADDTLPAADPSLVGSWVVANTKTNAAFGSSAIGIVDGLTLPTGDTFFPSDPIGGGLFLQTFNPQSLTDSEIFFIGLASPNGNSTFRESEVGPIPAALPDGHAVCCDAVYFDNLETFVSLPNVCLTCSETAKIAENDALKAIDLPAIIPASIPADTSGFVRLTNCVVGDDTDGILPIGDTTIATRSLQTFLFAFHGQAVGPFGTLTAGQYTLE